jgi:hypothetical protein
MRLKIWWEARNLSGMDLRLEIVCSKSLLIVGSERKETFNEIDHNSLLTAASCEASWG